MSLDFHSFSSGFPTETALKSKDFLPHNPVFFTTTLDSDNIHILVMKDIPKKEIAYVLQEVAASDKAVFRPSKSGISQISPPEELR